MALTGNIIDFTTSSVCPRNGIVRTRHLNRIKNVMIHHTASSFLGVYDLKKLHTEALHRWATIGYHYYVSKNGTIWKLNSIDKIVNGCTNHNENSIHICFEGNYEVDQFTFNFKYIIRSIFATLPLALPKLNLCGHRDKKNTLCPGKYLYTEVLLYNRNDNVQSELF